VELLEPFVVQASEVEAPPPLSRALRRRRPLQNRSAVAPVSPPHDHRTWEEIVEQRLHVRHRLDRYGARRWLELVAALAEPPAYRPVATDGATRAAALMAELL
jgi:hypothetical protein